MNKLLLLFTVLVLVSCGEKKEILLPKADVTVVKTISDISKIDFFFKTENKDTLAEINKNAIITATNWVFNIDKRLPLKTILPDIIKLQEKKLKKKSDGDLPKDNFYSYADSIGKNLAFLPFTNVKYVLENYEESESEGMLIIRFDKNNKLICNAVPLTEKELDNYIKTNFKDKKMKVCLIFDKNLSFDEYLSDKILFTKLSFPNLIFDGTEYVF